MDWIFLLVINATRKDLMVGNDVKKNILREAGEEEEREQAVKREKPDDNRFKAGEKEIRQGARDSDRGRSEVSIEVKLLDFFITRFVLF